MATLTTTYTLTNAWTQVGSAGQDMTIQTRNGKAMYALKATSPSATAAGHVLQELGSWSRSAIPSHLWARSMGGSDVQLAATATGTAGVAGTRSTDSFALTGTWTKVANSGEDVHLQNLGGITIAWAYSAAAPATQAEGHILTPGQEYSATAGENIWARSRSAGLNIASATLIITHG